MNDICIPLPRIEEQQIAEVEIRVNGKARSVHFRVEAFPWAVEETSRLHQAASSAAERRLRRLKSVIESYDRGWEMIQIYKPPPGAKFIKVLFRQRVPRPSTAERPIPAA